jgi:hypothetical protein
VISRITEGLTTPQIRVIRVRVLFLSLKVVTDFLTAAGVAFTASAIEAKGTPTKLVIMVALVGGVVAASKNLSDALSAALPPPVIANPNPHQERDGMTTRGTKEAPTPNAQ